MGRPTQVESKVERKSEQNLIHDLQMISALQPLEKTEGGHVPRANQILVTIASPLTRLVLDRIWPTPDAKINHHQNVGDSYVLDTYSHQ